MDLKVGKIIKYTILVNITFSIYYFGIYYLGKRDDQDRKCHFDIQFGILYYHKFVELHILHLCYKLVCKCYLNIFHLINSRYWINMLIGIIHHNMFALLHMNYLIHM